MFERDKNLDILKTSPEAIFEIYSSINTPLVAVEEYPTETTRAYIVILTYKKAEYNFYIFLHLLNSNKGIFYVHNGVKESDFSDTKNEAFNFVESMGFLMERVFSIEEGNARAQECINTMPMFTRISGESEAEEVVKLEDEAVIEIKEEVSEEKKHEDTGTIDEVEVLLDEVEKHEKAIESKPAEKKSPLGKIPLKSVEIKIEKPDSESVLKKFEVFFKFLSSF
jgi:hypothetical protein